MTVLTANLFNDRSDATDLEHAIVTHRPDVVAVQELGQEGAAVLERHYEHGKLRPQSDYNGMGLASTIDIDCEELDTPEPRPISGIALSESLDEPSTQPLRVMSVRLPPPFSRSWVSRRRRYVQTLIEHINSHEAPLCLLGDLNATPLWPAYRRLTRRLSDGARHSQTPVPASGATWPGQFPVFRIDHVLVRSIRVSRVSRIFIKGTDHRALLAEMIVLDTTGVERLQGA